MAKYLPVCYSNHDLKLPEMNWQVSVSVDMFNFADEAPYKVFWQSEPPELLDTQDKLIKNHKFYDLILTWNAEVLSRCSNAKLFPPGAVWTIEPDTSQKEFQVSYLTSSKSLCFGHEFRQQVFAYVPTSLAEAMKLRGGGTEQEALADFPYLSFLPVMKHRSPPYLPDKRGLLVPFQFSIIMENTQRNNNFTEKISDAFATKTIPIYWGAPNIGEFYNPVGVLSWNTLRDLFDILNRLTPEYYASKRDVIEENYQRALKYVDRTGNLVKAITDSWTPRIDIVHSGEPNVP
jgi:hypothetical protein